MLNHVILMGRLTADPEIKTTSGGKSVTNFTLAVDKFRREDGADFINCVAWEQTASFISRYFTKGSMIAVGGSIQTRKYTDKDGNNRTAFEVVVREASFCGGKNEGGTQPTGGTTANAVEYVDAEEADEDLPF